MPSLSCISGKGADADAASSREARKRSRSLDGLLRKMDYEERKRIKVLLLGTGESGKSTITKQMKIIHVNGFSIEERNEKIKDIRKNVRDCILEFFDHTRTLWADAGVLRCYQRSSEYQLLDCAKYFLDKVNEIGRDDYLPSDQDILRCRVMTNQILRIDYVVKDGRSDVPFSVFDVGGQRGERRKWIQVFEGINAILFLVDCSSFDQVLREDASKNRLLEALEIFEDIMKNRFLKRTSTILFINKIDLLEEKIRNGKSLSGLIDAMDPQHKYYSYLKEFYETRTIKDQERTDFLEAFPMRDSGRSDSVDSGRWKLPRTKSRTMSQRTDVDFEIIKTAVFIKRVFMKIAVQYLTNADDNNAGRTCEHYYTCAIDTDNIRKVLEGCRSIIIRKYLVSYGIIE